MDVDALLAPKVRVEGKGAKTNEWTELMRKLSGTSSLLQSLTESRTVAQQEEAAGKLVEDLAATETPDEDLLVEAVRLSNDALQRGHLVKRHIIPTCQCLLSACEKTEFVRMVRILQVGARTLLRS